MLQGELDRQLQRPAIAVREPNGGDHQRYSIYFYAHSRPLIRFTFFNFSVPRTLHLSTEQKQLAIFRQQSWIDSASVQPFDKRMSHFPQGELIHSQRSKFQTLSIYQSGPLRLLRIDDQAIQSACDLSAPQRLCLPYSRMMMGAFLFQPTPQRFLILGLGGGDMVRYLHHSLPRCHITAVDIDAVTIDIARRYFALPESRVDIVCGDAGAFVSCDNRTEVDTLFVDLYIPRQPPPLLYDAPFFSHCRDCLSRSGVMVLNVITEDAGQFREIVRQVRERFDYRCVCAKVPGHSNVIIFAFNREPAQTLRADLLATARQLSQRYELDFNAIVDALFDTNPLKEGELIL